MTGWGSLLVGIAAVIAAVAGLMNRQGLKRVDRKADTAAGLAEVSATHAAEAATNTAAVVRTLGPENGQTLRDVLEKNTALLAEVVKFEEYQHRRNHDMLAGIAQVQLAVPTLVAAIERLMSRINDTDGGGGV